MTTKAYRTSEKDPHMHEEYHQWARILDVGNPVHGMLLILVQKLCTTFHEIEPAFAQGALSETGFAHFQGRLVRRVQDVLESIEDNALDPLGVTEPFREMLERIKASTQLRDLVALAEPVHQLTHVVCDALEAAGTA